MTEVEAYARVLRRIARQGCEVYWKRTCDDDRVRTEGNRNTAFRVCDPCQARRVLARFAVPAAASREGKQ